MKIRFIHTADLHLETPFKGLSDNNEGLANKLKDATFNAFRNIVNVCISRRVDFLVIAGDIFDNEIKSIQAQLRFISELKRLSDHHIPVYFNCGNHDFLDSWSPSLHMPPGIYRFGKNLECFTYQRDGMVIADIYGISFAKKEVKENLASRYKMGDHPSPFSIAVLHGTIGPAGAHHNYAPFELGDIRSESFDYWALGHIHNKSIVYDAHPMVIYPGNPQGRDFGETGAKGCFLVDIEGGQIPQIEFIPVQTIRFEKIAIDISGIDDITLISQKVPEAFPSIEDYDATVSIILRIRFTGRTGLHAQLNKPGASEDLRNALNEDQLTEDPFLWVAQIDIDTRPDINLDEISQGNDFPAEALQVFDHYSEDGNSRKDLLKKIEAEMLSAPIKKELVALGSGDEKELIEKAKWLILDQILTQ